MEKFRIAQYGFIQMVVLAYGILSAGAMAKLAKQTWADANLPPPPIFDTLSFYRDYGLLLASVILVWAAFCAFHSTFFSKMNIGEDEIVSSGMILTGLFFAIGTFMLMGGIVHMEPPLSYK